MGDLIDSSVFIDLERRGVRIPTILRQLRGEISLAAITASELLVGVHLANSLDRRQQRLAFVSRILDSVPILPFDLQVARTHARLVSDLRRAGTTVGPHDLQIAATALTHGLQLVTLNIREFDRVPDLSIKPFSA